MGVESPHQSPIDTENVSSILVGERPTLPLGPGVEVLGHHACGLLALRKPPGILSHPNRSSGESSRSLLAAPYDASAQCYRVGDREIHLLHRLDSGTSGVILVATCPEIASNVRAAFSEDRVEKVYHALVKYRPNPNSGHWNDRLRKSHEGGGVRSKTGEGAMARTRYRWVKVDPNGLNISLLELRPLTGRTHQLRVQCEKHECYILGDKTYGSFSWNRKLFGIGVPDRLYLHASSISLKFAGRDGSDIEFSASCPLPHSFRHILERNPTLRNEWRKSLPVPSKIEPAWKKAQRSLTKRKDPLTAYRESKLR